MPVTVEPQWPSRVPCPIAFIGEAPGDAEIGEGKPFVGPAGKLFNKLLGVAGIERRACLVTNVFNAKLPDNDVKNWCGTTKERKVWEKDGYDLPPVAKGKHLRPEYGHHLDRLRTELEAAQPQIIVPMGGTALWAFEDHLPAISKRRVVPAYSNGVLPGAKILPTFHPAALFHAWKMFYTIVGDLKRAWEEKDIEGIQVTERELVLRPTLFDIALFEKDHIIDAPYLVIDIETIPSFRHITCVGFADGPHNAICIPFADREGGGSATTLDELVSHVPAPRNSYWSTIDQELNAWAFIERWCNSTIPKVLQGGQYDLYWLWELMGIRVRNYSEDTMLMAHAQVPELPKDLGFLGSNHARAPAWKADHKAKGGKRND